MAKVFDKRYEIIRRLGSGGMADVFLARDTHLGRQVAIKILYKRYTDDEEFVARFRREAEAAAGLNHPHIVSVYDRGESNGNYYIAMEYLEGRSLKEVIAEHGRLEPAQAIDIAEQILEALQFAHENNVIHRDIKPHNIIINGRGRVKVTDFGIARAGSATRMTETGSIIGTAQYLSPEQARGTAVEQGSDLYSVGVVLYEMLTGKVPFEGENPVAIALKHLGDEPVPPKYRVPELPDNLNSVVLKSLAKDPARRYKSADEFMEDLERCRQNLPVAAPLVAADTAATAILTPEEASAAGQSTMVKPAQTAVGGKKKSRRTLILTVALLALIAALAIAGVGYYLAFVSGGSVTVPSVTGLDQQVARETLEAKGFRVVIKGEEANPNVPAGQVISQDPEAGAKLKKNGTVSLVISSGDKMVVVPNLVGQSASYVGSKLDEFGLHPDRQPDVYSDTVPEGTVISQDPAAGASVAEGTSIKYVVSKGPEPPKEVDVPSLAGKTLEEATAELSNANLALGEVTQQSMNSVPAGQVVSQDPAAGQKVKEGSKVNVTVSKGPETPQTTVPNVIGLSQGSAVTMIEGRNLQAAVHDLVTSDNTQWGKVVSQSPVGETAVAEGSTVVINIGRSP
jgi:beta-lactam-binding protein with PASTA domain/predicted Ser/Thr protein kinase